MSNDEIIEEGKKLLFVAMTRATELLFLSSLYNESSIFSLFNKDGFINLDFENNNFEIIFGRELSTNKNITIENESKRYDVIKEIKEIEKRIISEINDLRKETSLKFKDLKNSEKNNEEPKIIEKKILRKFLLKLLKRLKKLLKLKFLLKLLKR